MKYLTANKKAANDYRKKNNRIIGCCIKLKALKDINIDMLISNKRRS